MRNRTGYLISLISLMLGFSHSAHAADMSYAFIEANALVNADYEFGNSINADGDGFGFAFGFLMGPVAYSEWRFQQYDIDGNVDGTEVSIRFGVRKRIDGFQYGKLDVYGGIHGDYAKFDGGQPNVDFIDDSGIGGYIGLRHGPNRHFEYGLEFAYSNLEDNLASASVHAQWNATHAVALRLTYREADYHQTPPDIDLNTLLVAARVTFGTP